MVTFPVSWLTFDPDFKVATFLKLNISKGKKFYRILKPYPIYRMVPLSMTLSDLWSRRTGSSASPELLIFNDDCILLNCHHSWSNGDRDEFHGDVVGMGKFLCHFLLKISLNQQMLGVSGRFSLLCAPLLLFGLPVPLHATLQLKHFLECPLRSWSPDFCPLRSIFCSAHVLCFRDLTTIV